MRTPVDLCWLVLAVGICLGCKPASIPPPTAAPSPAAPPAAAAPAIPAPPAFRTLDATAEAELKQAFADSDEQRNAARQKYKDERWRFGV